MVADSHRSHQPARKRESGTLSSPFTGIRPYHRDWCVLPEVPCLERVATAPEVNSVPVWLVDSLPRSCQPRFLPRVWPFLQLSIQRAGNLRAQAGDALCTALDVLEQFGWQGSKPEMQNLWQLEQVGD